MAEDNDDGGGDDDDTDNDDDKDKEFWNELDSRKVARVARATRK